MIKITNEDFTRLAVETRVADPDPYFKKRPDPDQVPV